MVKGWTVVTRGESAGWLERSANGSRRGRTLAVRTAHEVVGAREAEIGCRPEVDGRGRPVGLTSAGGQPGPYGFAVGPVVAGRPVHSAFLRLAEAPFWAPGRKGDRAAVEVTKIFWSTRLGCLLEVFDSSHHHKRLIVGTGNVVRHIGSGNGP